MGMDESGGFDREKFIVEAEKDRISSNEALAVIMIRTIGTAIYIYYDDKDVYPKDLFELKDANSPYAKASHGYGDFTKARSGYKYELKDGGSSSYFIIAYPVSVSAFREKYVGENSFCIFNDGIVRVRQGRDPIESYNVCQGLEEVR